jgi:hypothetical protein
MRRAYHTLDLTEAVLLKDHLLHNAFTADLICRSCGDTPTEPQAAGLRR